MVEPIVANNIHEKQLAPHIRKRIRGLNQTNTYSEIVRETNEIYEGTAGETIEPYDLICFVNGSIFKASATGNPAAAIAISGGAIGSTIRYSFDKQIVLASNLTSSPWLSTNGDWSVIPYTTVGGWLQSVGTRIDNNSFILDIGTPYRNV